MHQHKSEISLGSEGKTKGTIVISAIGNKWLNNLSHDGRWWLKKIIVLWWTHCGWLMPYICCNKIWSWLVQIMACCLSAPNHYLNHRWHVVIWAHRKKSKYQKTRIFIQEYAIEYIVYKMSAILLCQILPKPCGSSPVLLISYQEPRSMLDAGQNGMQPLHRDSADPQGCTLSAPAKLTENKIEPHHNAVNFFLTCSQ